MTNAMRPITIEIPAAVAHKITETFEGTVEDAARAGLKLIHGMGPAAYDTLQALAAQLDTTPAKVLRTAIQQMADHAATMKLTATNVGRPKINTQRDAKVYERLKAGLTHVQVADEFGLSVVRVGQIAAQQRHINGDAPRRGRKIVPAQPTQPPQPESSTQETFKVKTPEALAEGTPTPAPAITQPTPDTPTPPRKLAVIPPSMRNPELFAEAKPIKFPDPAKVDVSMFDPNNPDFAI
jgi:hypothetical protein